MIPYRERVLPSIANLALPLLLFPSVFAVMLPIDAPLALPVAVVITAAFLGIIFVSSPVIEITDNELSAKSATISRKLLGRATKIEKSEIFEELGVRLDARAWLAIQASVKGLVKVELNDPEDSTPYWLISTRKPDLLVSELNRKV